MRVVVLAGESSGDQLGAGLIRELRERWPHAEFAGIAGPAMQEAGCTAWYDAEELAVMGLVEVLRHLPRLLRLRRDLLERIDAYAPDCLIGIDAPDFNLKVEQHAKTRGVPTVHYVSPSVWAWRQRRVQRMRDCCDLVLTLFPFEPAVYATAGLPAEFVGHPFADEIPLDADRDACRTTLGLPPEAKVLAVLPGSRMGEISRLAMPFAQAVALLRQRLPDLAVVAPCVHARAREAIDSAFTTAGVTDALLCDGQARTALMAADATLIASGTATLEALLCRCPMVVAYKLSPLTHFIVRRLGLLKTDRYALPNNLGDRDLVPELMQDAATPAALADAVATQLAGGPRIEQMIAAFRAIHQSLQRDASRQAARAVAGLLRT